MTRLRRLLSDMQRTVAGIIAFFRHLLGKQVVEIGLGQLRAESAVAVRGRQNRYLITISNARAEPRDVTLTIDIYAEPPTDSTAHYARFSKRLRARPRGSTAVDVRYDWLGGADFVVGDMRAPADDLWRGGPHRSSAYSVNASLLDPSGHRLERLTVYQTLTP